MSAPKIKDSIAKCELELCRLRFMSKNDGYIVGFVPPTLPVILSAIASTFKIDEELIKCGPRNPVYVNARSTFVFVSKRLGFSHREVTSALKMERTGVKYLEDTFINRLRTFPEHRDMMRSVALQFIHESSILDT